MFKDPLGGCGCFTDRRTGKSRCLGRRQTTLPVRVAQSNHRHARNMQALSQKRKPEAAEADQANRNRFFSGQQQGAPVHDYNPSGGRICTMAANELPVPGGRPATPTL